MKRAIVVMGVISSLGWSGSAAWARDDFQTWHSAEIVKRFGSTWEVAWLPEIRIRDDASQLFYHEYRQSIRGKPSAHLQIGLNYLFVRNESSGKPLEEHTGELDITPKASAGPWEASVRGRLALRTIQRSAGEQEWQVRLMPKLAYRTTWGGRTLRPYVANDLFYDCTRKAWNQSRLYLGVSVPLGQAAGADVSVEGYYMLQSQLGSARRDWSSNHVLGTKLGVGF